MKKKALIVFGGWDGHEPEKVSSRLGHMLMREGFTVEISDTLDSFADEERLKKLDLIVPCWTQGTLEDDYQFAISHAVQTGVGIAGVHGGMCDAFRWNIEWQFMTGSQWVSHPGDKYYDHISVLPADGVFKNPVPEHAYWREYTVNVCRHSSSPLVEGIKDFKVFSEQYYLHIDPVINVLATTYIDHDDGPHITNGPVTMPVVYTKLWGKGKIFYSSLGHLDSVFEIPEAMELTRRGFLWAAKG